VGAVDARRIIRRVVAHQGINAQQVEVPLSRWVERASQPQADSATSKSRHWPADAMTANTAPLVTREALQAFTQRLVKHFAPEQVILFGSQARGEARWDSDADILVVMSFEGRPQDSEKTMRNTCEPAFPLDLHLRRPQEIAPRYRWGDPFIREALNHGVMLHGEGLPDALCPGDGGPGQTSTQHLGPEFTPRPATRW
jgi:predicted nucleotidyltransferase